MNAVVYKMCSSLDSSTSNQEQEKILSVFDQNCSVILDMTDCTYVSSAGLRVMLYSYKLAASKGLKVGVCDEVRDVMSMTGFEKFFEYFDTVEECQKSI